MLGRSLSSVRNRFSPTYQVRWKSEAPIRRILSPDRSKYPSTAFVSINLKRPPTPTPSPESRPPSKSSSHVRSNLKLNEPSLFTELFPEEAQKNNKSQISSDIVAAKFPPLEIPTVAELLEDTEGSHSGHLNGLNTASKEASDDAKSHKKTTLLVLELASKSLVESDFRRVAPKGAHIDGWTGPGDILRGEFHSGHVLKQRIYTDKFSFSLSCARPQNF